MSYLGKKGYSILKSDLTIKEELFIRNEKGRSPLCF